MIGRIRGIILEKQAPEVLVEAHGVGYEVQAPLSTFYRLPPVGQEVVLHTHFVVREDAQQLFGFLTHKEREAFRALIRISGVGPKLALSVLSGLSVGDLAQCVVMQDAGRLTRVPGIGKKTAERLLLELKGKLADALPTGPGGAPTSAGVAADALNALLALGYSDKEAVPAIKQLPDGLSLEESIRQALKLLAKK